MGRTQRVKHIGAAIVHLRAEVPLLLRVIHKGPDVVDSKVAFTLQKRVCGKAVAKLVLAAVDAAAIG